MQESFEAPDTPGSVKSIKSQFRRLLFARVIFDLLSSLFIVFIFYYFAYTRYGLRIDNALVWMGLLVFAIIVANFKYSFIYPFKKIEVNENAINVRFLLYGREAQINYNEIKSCKVARGTRNFGASSVIGTEEFQINLKNGDALCFNESEFTNYKELKYFIYKYAGLLKRN